MIHSIINGLLFISTLIFFQLKHPLAIGFLLLIQTTLVCLITGIIAQRFWFSYILFLVFLGGILVLFIYVTSLASNEIFRFSLKLLLIFFIGGFLFFIISLFIDNMGFYFLNNFEMIVNNTFSEIKLDNLDYIFKLYNFPTNWMTCIIVNYLLFTLIVVVKVTNFFYGPLRILN